MRFLKLYLVGYFILLLGAALALWQSGILRQISGIWLAIGAIIAVGFGIMLAVRVGTSGGYDTRISASPGVPLA